MKKLALVTFLFLLANSHLWAQCPDDNINSTQTISVTPSTFTVNTGEYATLQVTANSYYTITTCFSPGLVFDPMLALYGDTPTPSTLLADNDDFCGPYSEICWFATFTGNVRIVVDEFDFINGPCYASGIPQTVEVYASPAQAWTGAVDTDWSKTGNWSAGQVPGSGDLVVIPPTANDPIISGDQGTVECITIHSGATLTVDVGGKIRVFDAVIDGILVDGGNLINNGSIVIEYAYEDGLDLESAGSCTNNGSIQIKHSGDDGLDIDDEPFLGAMMDNSGTLYISDSYFTGIDIEEGASMTNFAGGIIQISTTEDESLHLDGDGSSFDNYGQITINNGQREGIEVDANTTFTNHSKGRIFIINTGVESGEDDAIDNDGDFVNDGTITINGDGTSDIGIKTDTYFENNGHVFIRNVRNEAVYNEGTFENNLLLHIGTGGANSIASLANVGGTFNNGNCGIVNVTTQNLIANVSPATLTNEGQISTVFTGSNFNDATFTNNGSIAESNGVFPIASNALVGSGTVINGPIPISSAANGCPRISLSRGIPTLSEWGMILLALAMMALAVTYLKVPKLSITDGSGFQLHYFAVDKKQVATYSLAIGTALFGVFLLAILALGYQLTSADIWCSPIAVGLSTYVVSKMKEK